MADNKQGSHGHSQSGTSEREGGKSSQEKSGSQAKSGSRSKQGSSSGESGASRGGSREQHSEGGRQGRKSS